MIRTLVLSALLALPAASVAFGAQDQFDLAQRDAIANNFVGVARDNGDNHVEVAQYQQKGQSSTKLTDQIKAKVTSSKKTSTAHKVTSTPKSFPHAPPSSAKTSSGRKTSSSSLKGSTINHGTAPFSAPGVRATSSKTSSTKGGKVFSTGKSGGLFGDNSLSAGNTASASASNYYSSDDYYGPDEDSSSVSVPDTTDVWTPVGSSEWLVPTKPFDPQPTAFSTVVVKVSATAHASASVKGHKRALDADVDDDVEQIV